MKNKKKNHSGAKKRFKLSKNGNIKYTKSGRRHLLTKKNSKEKRMMRKSIYICSSDKGHIKSLIDR